MKGGTMRAKLQELGVKPSYSRPSTSNDNPYSEALFATLKHLPAYPTTPFISIDAARGWVADFAHWYNTTHRHSGIRFVTPQQRHNGEDTAILATRDKLYQAKKEANPGRWSGKTRNWEPIGTVWLNPDKEAKEAPTQLAA